VEDSNMRAMAVVPGRVETAAVIEIPEPAQEDGAVLVEGLLVGICGTDREISEDGYGEPPPGEEHLILGHESLGRVLEAPEASELAPGDLVMGVVRRPDPVPCPCCARGEWDFCRNGRYTERGIKGRHGYGAQRWRVEPDFAVRIDPDLGDLGVLVEPASVVAKGWEQIERITARACSVVQRVLVTGAGPIGLLAAELARQRGLDLVVLDRSESGPKPELARALGATYVTDLGDVTEEPDVVVECTGYGPLVLDLARRLSPGGVMCLTGLSASEEETPAPLHALNRDLVLANAIIVGTVNAARRHYELAVAALAAAEKTWLERLLTRRVPLDRWPESLQREPNDVKVAIDLRG
jgi:threonine dehydrogenase-like Zn-dependent dehydrogenase